MALLILSMNMQILFILVTAPKKTEVEIINLDHY